VYGVLKLAAHRFGAKVKERNDAQDRERQRHLAIAQSIRKIYHEAQRRFVESKADQRAGLCTRRAGKTFLLAPEFIATALEEPGSHQIYGHETRAEARRLMWRGNHGRDGLLPRLHQYGLDRECKINKTELSITFPNGSIIELIGLNDEDQINKLRGNAFRRVVLDEGQKVRNLQELVEDVLQPALRDYQQIGGRPGELWMFGTPSKHPSGYFFEVTNAENPLPGWEVHRWSVRDNPFWGGTPDERWDKTAGEILRKNNWTGDEPKFRREWKAEWVYEDASYVYAIHQVQEHARYFAPLRSHVDGSYDHETALKDLPRTWPLPQPTTPATSQRLVPMARNRSNGRLTQRLTTKARPITWLFALGVDLGYDPGAFAVVLWAYSHDCPDVYEMWSWKKTGLVPDAQAEAVKRVIEIARPVIVVGDPGGLGKGELAGWRERHSLPIDDAEKAQKRTWQEFFNGDLTAGRVHFRQGSPLVHEMEHLLWVPETKKKRPGNDKRPVEWANRALRDKSVPGNHNCDAGLYGYRHLTHYLGRGPENDETEEERMENQVDEDHADSEDADDIYSRYS
jgi:hypothetical protein